MAVFGPFLPSKTMEKRSMLSWRILTTTSTTLTCCPMNGRFSKEIEGQKDAFLKWTNEKNNKDALEYAGHLERIFSHYAIIPYS